MLTRAIDATQLPAKTRVAVVSVKPGSPAAFTDVLMTVTL
jgi:hypothetical protein